MLYDGLMERSQRESITFNIKEDHIHTVSFMLPRLSISEVMGILKQEIDKTL